MATRKLLAQTQTSTREKALGQYLQMREYSHLPFASLANVGESPQNGLANVGESGESRKNVSTQVLAKVHMIRYVIL